MIPQHHPKTLHLTPYWWNNSWGGLVWGAARGYKFADQDMQCDLDGTFWGTHWPLPHQDGYRWIWTGKKDKLGREIRTLDPYPEKKISQRGTAEVARLRKYAHGGGAAWRYRKAAEHAKRCQKLGMVMCGEAKGSPGFEDPRNWRKFQAELRGRGVKIFYVMTLQDIGDWHARAMAVHIGSTLEIALLPRGGHKPTPERLAAVDAVWGHW